MSSAPNRKAEIETTTSGKEVVIAKKNRPKKSIGQLEVGCNLFTEIGQK